MLGALASGAADISNATNVTNATDANDAASGGTAISTVVHATVEAVGLVLGSLLKQEAVGPARPPPLPRLPPLGGEAWHTGGKARTRLVARAQGETHP